MNGFQAAPPRYAGLPEESQRPGRQDTPAQQIRVLIVENQEVLRRGLLDIASAVPEIAARTVAGAVAAPGPSDIVIASTSTLESLEAEHGVDHLRPLLVAVPTNQPRHLELAIKRPARGYLILAELTPDTLRASLHEVMRGRIPIPDTMAEYLLNRARGFDASQLRGMYHLSPREAEVLGLLVAGYGNKEIAGRLHISIHGVKRHVSALLSRFHSPNRAHLVSYILKSGVAAPTEQ